MRQFILLITTSLILSNSIAQLNIPVPEFKNTIKQVDTSKKTLQNLEKAIGGFDRKIKALGYGGSEIYLRLNGIGSSVTFESTQATFVIKLPDSDTDPSSYVELYKFDSKRNKREVIVSKMGYLGGVKTADIPKVDLIFSKISPGSYLITMSKALAKGSYGFIFDPASIVKQAATVSATVFAFDIN